MGVGRFIRKAPVRLALALRRPDAFDDAKAEARLKDYGERFVSGKDVAIVGNAQSIFNCAFGSEIDAHDMVVRMNHGVVRSPDHQGARTDCLCLASDVSRLTVERNFGNPAIIFTTTHRDRMTFSLAAGVQRLYFCPRAIYHGLETELAGRRPSTGLVAIRLFDEFFKAGKITLYGFDWMETKTTYREDLRAVWHDWEREREMVTALISARPDRFRLRLVGSPVAANTGLNDPLS